MLTLAEAVEISLGGVAPQAAVDHKFGDGGVAQSHTATQGLVHRLLVVHLAVAHRLLALAIALAVLTAFLDKLLGGDELDAGIPHVAAMNGLGVGVLAHEFQFRSKRATGETDLDYMDSYMECLHDFMEQGGDAESLYLEYIDHIATFSPLTAEERKDYLEETLGYKTEIAYAAAFVAREICRVEKGTGGDEFFKSHCWRVGSHGHDGKIMVTGFLYHVVEDLGYDAHRLIQLTKEKLTEWMREPKNDSWRYNFDEEELMPFAGEKCIPPTEEEWNELIGALNLLNEKTAKDKRSYLSRFKDKYLPIKVKIEDLEHQPTRDEEHHLFLQMLWY